MQKLLLAAVIHTAWGSSEHCSGVIVMPRISAENLMMSARAGRAARREAVRARPARRAGAARRRDSQDMGEDPIAMAAAPPGGARSLCGPPCRFGLAAAGR